MKSCTRAEKEWTVRRHQTDTRKDSSIGRDVEPRE